MSAFKNGDIVETKTDIYGKVQAYRPELHPTLTSQDFGLPEGHLPYNIQTPTKNPGKSGPPGSEINEPVRIPKGKTGVVMYSDEIDTIVMFPIHETDRLEPQLIKAQGFTKNFKRVVKMNPPALNPKGYEKSIDPFRLEQGGRQKKNVQKPLEEPEKSIMGEIVDVSPVKKFLSKITKSLTEIPAGSDPFEWQGGLGPHAQLLDAQDIDFESLSPEDQKKAVINSLRVGVLSPMKDLSHNAFHYQDIAHIDPDENDYDVYEDALQDARKRWNKENELYKRRRPRGLGAEYEHGMLLGDDDYQQPQKEHLYWQKYPGYIKDHLRSIAKLGEYADYLTQVAREDIEKTGGKGNLWREALRKINVPGVNNKVASFAWLLLRPKTSELATIDRHMMNFLSMDEKNTPSSDKAYENYENRLREVKSQYPEYENMPLGPFQWAVWDYVRTGPGSHQLHEPLKPINFEPYWETEWHKRVKKPKKVKPKTGLPPMENQIGFDLASAWKKKNKWKVSR